MAGQFDRYENNTGYWTLTPYSANEVYNINHLCQVDYAYPPDLGFIRPSINLKSNVQIVNGDGTKENPFTLELQ